MTSILRTRSCCFFNIAVAIAFLSLSACSTRKGKSSTSITPAAGLARISWHSVLTEKPVGISFGDFASAQQAPSEDLERLLREQLARTNGIPYSNFEAEPVD